jgi:DHA1 family multidrug resistance protein-like MFS transporter
MPVNGRRGPILILFVSLVVAMLGFGIIVPIMPFYVTHFGASGRALGFLMAIYSVMQFLFAPVWGRLSDRIGRKPVLLVGVTGFAFSFVLMGVSQSLIQLFLFRALAGILSSATLPTALAFIADTTTPDDRSGGMGLMGAAMGLGMIFGPLVGGPLTEMSLRLPGWLAGLMQISMDSVTGTRLNLSLPFMASAVFAAITVPCVLAFLPESLPAEKRHIGPNQGPSRLVLIADALRGPMGFLFITSFLLAFALANLESVLGLFGRDRFAMGPSQVGMVMGLIGILSVLQQGLVIGPLTRRIGEDRVLQAGLVVSVAGLTGLALAPVLWQMLVMAALFNAGNSLLRPSVASLISQRARTGQGVAMGLENSFMSLGRVAGPLWGGIAFDIHSTLPFWTGAAIQAIALALSFRLLRQTAPEASPAAAQGVAVSLTRDDP